MHTNELTKSVFASSPNKIQWISGDHCFDCTNSHLKVSEWVLWQVCNSMWCLENIWPTTDRSMRQQFQDTWGQAGFWQAGYRVSSHWENAAQFARTQHSDAGHCPITGASGIGFSSGMGSASCRNPNGAPRPKRHIVTRFCSHQAE